ncbi:MAG: RNA polymerase sigma factor [Bacteroidales bacterium]
MRNYTEEEILKGCLKNKRKYQELLYHRYSSHMYAVCLRYAKREEDAYDILQDGFVKVFSHLKDFKGNGSFEGWIRRTIVNTAINYYRKNVKFQNNVGLEYADYSGVATDDLLSQVNTRELQEMISELPDGYRLVFNLNAIEGYTHKEIGEMLNISENTSKSQLSRARVVLQSKFEKLYAI